MIFLTIMTSRLVHSSVLVLIIILIINCDPIHSAGVPPSKIYWKWVSFRLYDIDVLMPKLNAHQTIHFADWNLLGSLSLSVSVLSARWWFVIILRGMVSTKKSQLVKYLFLYEERFEILVAVATSAGDYFIWVLSCKLPPSSHWLVATCIVVASC